MAKLVLSPKINGALCVVLPLELDDYLKNFAGEASRSEFQSLLDRAEAILFPPGRGRWWAEATNRQIAAIKSARDGVEFVQSECFNEALGATLDNNLIWTDRYPWEAPLLGSVYGGWLPYYGSRVYPDENIVTFTAKLTRDLFWGGAIGCVINEWWAESNSTAHARVILSLAKFRRAARDFLVYGEMVRPPKILGEPVWMKLAGWQGDYSQPIRGFEMEAIERVAFLARDGRIGLALMNYDEGQHVVEFDLSTIPGRTRGSLGAVIQLPGSTPVTARLRSQRLEVRLPSRTPALVVIGQEANTHDSAV